MGVVEIKTEYTKEEINNREFFASGAGVNKTPEELKSQVIDESGCCGTCECYHTTVDNPFGCQEAQAKTMLVMELVKYTEQLESTTSQLSKALCNKGSATLDELLNSINQLKVSIACAERERDAAIYDLEKAINMSGIHNLDCEFCEDKDKPYCKVCYWVWRGICEENTKEQ